jgi:inosine/xanthosine triphosphate pyrophosphatase family protein
VDVPDGQRGARFVCAAAIALPDGVTKVVEGRLDGALVEKDAISHRGRAFRAVVPFVAELRGRTAWPTVGGAAQLDPPSVSCCRAARDPNQDPL